jgi:hypothetical protein
VTKMQRRQAEILRAVATAVAAASAAALLGSA